MTAGESPAPPKPAPVSTDSPAQDEDEFRPVRSPFRTSASLSTRPGRSELRPAKGSVDYDKKPLPEGSDPPEKGSVEGSGSGCQLPELENLQWEENAKGGWEAWHVPDGAFQRKDKTYLGHVGKRQLAAWSRLSPTELRRTVEGWIADKRAAKGIG